MAFTAHSLEPRNRQRKYDLARELVGYSDEKLTEIWNEFQSVSPLVLFLKLLNPFGGRKYFMRYGIADDILKSREIFQPQEEADEFLLKAYRPTPLFGSVRDN